MGRLLVLGTLLLALIAVPVAAQEEEEGEGVPVAVQEEEEQEGTERLNLAAAALTLDDLPAGFSFDAERSFVEGEEPLDTHYAQYLQEDAATVLAGQGPIVVGAAVFPEMPAETVLEFLLAAFVQEGADTSPFEGVPAVEGSVWQRFSGTIDEVPVEGYFVAFPGPNVVGSLLTFYLQGRASADETAEWVRVLGARLGAALEPIAPAARPAAEPTQQPVATATPRPTPSPTATLTPVATPVVIPTPRYGY